ncbi:Cobalt/magnesium transport protein CorA [Diplonema papillatum]|nr:Cobalt/magnesium transport protein CorA [Diplonema papillatum]
MAGLRRYLFVARRPRASPNAPPVKPKNPKAALHRRTNFTWENVSGANVELEEFKAMAAAKLEELRLPHHMVRECIGSEVLPMYSRFKNFSVIVLRIANYTSIRDVESHEIHHWNVSELTNRITIIVDSDANRVVTMHAHRMDFMDRVRAKYERHRRNLVVEKKKVARFEENGAARREAAAAVRKAPPAAGEAEAAGVAADGNPPPDGGVAALSRDDSALPRDPADAGGNNCNNSAAEATSSLELKAIGKNGATKSAAGNGTVAAKYDSNSKHKLLSKTPHLLRLDEFVFYIMMRLLTENSMSLSTKRKIFDEMEGRFVRMSRTKERVAGVTATMYGILRRCSVSKRVLSETVDLLTAMSLDPPSWSHRIGREPSFKRVQEQTEQALSFTDELHTSTKDFLSLYFGVAGHRTNELVRVLTLLNAIFIPLSFVAGFYGMNFEYMPGLGKPFEPYCEVEGVWFVVTLMAMTAGALITYFRVRKWL